MTISHPIARKTKYATAAMPSIKRRHFLGQSTASLALLTGTPALAQSSPAVISQKPEAPSGVQLGDVSDGRAVLWSRSDRPARMMVRWATTENMSDAGLAAVSDALSETDHATKVELAGLPAGQTIHYEVQFLDLNDYSSKSEPTRGSFKTAPAVKQDVRFVWSGDTAGQGWGINPDFGGMRAYETMRQVEPDFFIHSGDSVYADGPIAAEKETPDGQIWKNVTLEAKAKVAEILAEFRASYEYNLMDENVRRFNAQVPMYIQWDDHEVTNNWYWEMRKDEDERYKEGSVALMAARATRAFHEFNPLRTHPLDPNRI